MWISAKGANCKEPKRPAASKTWPRLVFARLRPDRWADDPEIMARLDTVLYSIHLVSAQAMEQKRRDVLCF